MKLFVISDIHSYFTPFKEALDKAGFDSENNRHYLVSLGDAFDRGPDSLKVLEFLINTKNKILVKGNHDLLLEELCTRKYPKGHDYHNGTFNTLLDLGDPGCRCKNASDLSIICKSVDEKLKEYRKQLVPYYETENYIFVHSWIVTGYKMQTKMSNLYNPYIPIYTKDWRNATDDEWAQAMWGNPFENAAQGLNKTGKTIVFGHWHCSKGHSMNKGTSEFGEDAIWDIYENTKQKIIGIDRCTAYTKQCNVLVLEDNLLQ